MKYLFIASLIVISCIANSQTLGASRLDNRKETKNKGRLLLKSGFEEGVSISDDMMKITGSDFPQYSWDTEKSWIASSRFEYVVGKGENVRDFMEAEIETTIGPFGKNTRVLRLTNIKDNENFSATSRVEFSFFGKEGPFEYQQGYVKYWMKLQANLNQIIEPGTETPFYMIMEWKEPNAKNSLSAEECAKCCNARAGGTNNYRINIGITRMNGVNKFNWKKEVNNPNLAGLKNGVI